MNIETIRNIQLTTYLQSIGFEPKSKSGNRLFYNSPFRPNEKTPSFVVTPNDNYFKDFASGQWGGVINFVMYYNNVDFKESVKILESFDGTSTLENNFFFSVCNVGNEITFKLDKVKTLENKALLKYLSERCINISIAKYHLKEAYFKSKYFALAFENDLGGFELRNKFWQGSTAPKTITTIKGTKKNAVLIFEGFIDFLSYLTIIKNDIPEFDTIVLNSVSNINTGIEILANYPKIYAVLDNDKAGIETLEKIKSDLPKTITIDCSKCYKEKDLKDLNDYLMRL